MSEGYRIKIARLAGQTVVGSAGRAEFDGEGTAVVGGEQIEYWAAWADCEVLSIPDSYLDTLPAEVCEVADEQPAPPAGEAPAKKTAARSRSRKKK